MPDPANPVDPAGPAGEPISHALARCADALLRFALARSVDRDAAHDAVQEALMAAVVRSRDDSSTPHWADDEELWAWLVGVARHKLADEFRRRGRRPVCLASLGVDASALIEPVTRGDDLPDAQASRAEVQQLCRLALSTLAPRYQDVLDRVHRLGQSHRDIGPAMGISPKAVESMLARARRELQLTLQRQLAEPERLL
ncbi:MAG: RNA polymerase sigma factor [Planctomycetota bacterium]